MLNSLGILDFDLRRKSVEQERQSSLDPESTSSLGLFVTLTLFLFYIIAVLYTVENNIVDYKVTLLYSEDKSRTIREEEKEVLFYVHLNDTLEPFMFQKIAYPDNIDINQFTVPASLSSPMTLLCPTYQEGTGKLETLDAYETIVFGFEDPAFEFYLPYGFSFQSAYWILLHFQWAQVEEVSETLSDNILQYLLMVFPSISLEPELPKLTLALKKVSVIEKKVPGSFTDRVFSVVVDSEVNLKRYNRFPFTYLVVSIITLLGSVLALRFPVTKCLQRFHSWIHPSYPYIQETVTVGLCCLLGFLQLYMNLEFIEPVFLWHLPIVAWKVCCVMLLLITLWQTGFCGSLANIEPSISWWIDCCIEPYATFGLYVNSLGLFFCFSCCWCVNCLTVSITTLAPVFLVIVFLMDVSDTSSTGDGNLDTRNFIWDVKVRSPVLVYTFSGVDFLCMLHLLVLVVFWKCCCMKRCVKKKKEVKRFKYRCRNEVRDGKEEEEEQLYDTSKEEDHVSTSDFEDQNYVKKNVEEEEVKEGEERKLDSNIEEKEEEVMVVEESETEMNLEDVKTDEESARTDESSNDDDTIQGLGIEGNLRSKRTRFLRRLGGRLLLW